MTKAQIKTAHLRIKSLEGFIALETNAVAAWNMARDIASERAKLARG